MVGRTTRTPGGLLALVALLITASLIVTSSTGLGEPAPAVDSPPSSGPEARLVTVEENSTQVLWPYTSRRRSFDTATLPINFVVDNDAAFVRYLLSESAGAKWNVTEYRGADASGNATDRNASTRVESGVVINGTSIRWTGARGSTRYTYVHDSTASEGRWMDETYQLHDGTYFGARYHVRMYEGGSGEDAWTAIQVHREHWDWFRLRHTVDSVDRAQDHLESEFRSSAFRLDIRRTWFANGGAIDSDGWVTSIDILAQNRRPMFLSGFALFAGFVAAGLTGDVGITDVRAALRGRLEGRDTALRHLLLLLSLSGLVLGVRVGAITVEGAVQGLSPKVIAGVFYPLLVLGTPACAVLLARGLDPGRSALTAAMGFGTGIAADYMYIDIAALPVEVVMHRMVLITTVAVLAAGGASTGTERFRDGGRSWNGLIVVGVLQWIVALLIPLIDLL